jgi:type 1 glutamine amidotransferase
MKIDPKRYNPSMPMANVEYLTSGHRTPNGIVVGPEGEIFVGENQGAWQPSNKINWIVPGGFYGHYNNTSFTTPEYPNGGVPGLFDFRPFTQPAVYVPHNECGNSPTQMLLIPDGEFKGQLLVGDVKYGGLSRAFLQKIDGSWQGGIVHYTHGFESGTHRLAWGRNGELYVGGIGASDTWGWTDPKTGKETRFGLQKIVPTGETAFEIHSLLVNRNYPLRDDGLVSFTLAFTRPIPKAWLESSENYFVRSWSYKPTPEYGGEKQDKQDLKVVRAIASADRRSVELLISNARLGTVMYLTCDPKADAGEQLWATEVWYTLNSLDSTHARPLTPSVLVFSKTAGFRHDSIGAGQRMFRRLDEKHPFTVTFSEDASVFNTDRLSEFDVVVFLCTTGDIFTPDQERAFESWYRSGGGFVGIHAAADTEYDWPFFADVVGASFHSHPAIQQAAIRIEHLDHETMAHLPKTWTRVDEWYNYRRNPRPFTTVLATLDETTYSGGNMGADHPIIWCREFAGGRSWYTGLGHTDSTYAELLFEKMITNAVFWAAR